MKKKWLVYVIFSILLLTGFYFFLFKDTDFSQSNLPVINDHVLPFSFIDQNGKTITEKSVEGKVYVTEYFFTTCKGICPEINANMRRVFDVFKNDSDFLIISHTCMPETDSVPLLKRYEYKMLTGTLTKDEDGLYKIENAGSQSNPDETLPATYKTNWFFVTGDKASLYNMAEHSYLIADNKVDTSQKISDQFLHTQLFALVDKQRRVRGIYDGLKEDEIQKLLSDIKDLLKEKLPKETFINGFNSTPN
jgi:protein SCO1/2